MSSPLPCPSPIKTGRGSSDHPAFCWSDVFMLGVVVVWGLNFSVIKIALRELSPAGFNGVRLLLTAAVLAVLLAFSGEGFRFRKTDFWKLALIGMMGNGFYQVLFINGLSLTTASNTSFILAISPALVALLGVLFRVEKIHWVAWMGILVSLAGLYLVIASGEGLRFSSRGARGDLMILSGTVLWSLYTVFSKGFLDRLSPLKFTTITVFFGAMTYLPFSLGEIVAIPWSRVSWGAWGGLVFSAVFSLVLGYLVWYSSVQRVGNARTAIYSNLTPFVTAVFASLFLGEALGVRKIVGGVVILAGVYLARSGYYHFLKCRPDVG